MAPPLVGSEEPRLWTRPLRDLTPETSLGFACIRFADEVLGVELDAWQKWLLTHALELNPDGTFRFRTVLLLVARQNGKALDRETPLLTAAGWKTMGTVGVGDEVFHPDGAPVKVLGAYDQPDGRECFRVTTTDGRSIVADADHLWTVQDRRVTTRVGRRDERGVRSCAWVTLTTAELLRRGLMRGAREFAYRLPPVTAAVQTPAADLPIDPYVLGAWLGDGTSTAACLTVGDQDLHEMVEHLTAAGAREVSRRRGRTAWNFRFNIDGAMRDGFEARCRRLGVWDNKHAPDEYLTASPAQRLALLQGLMDTDGSIGAAGQAEFCSTRRELADAVLFLVRSLGYRTTIKESAATLRGVEVGRRWRVCFTPTTDGVNPFRLRRKAARVQVSDARGGELHAVSIRSIEPVESRPVRCIAVDRWDGLFLAGRDLVPTHNTTVLRVLTLWLLWTGRVKLAVGTAQDLDIARRNWREACAAARLSPDIAADLDGRPRMANGQESLLFTNGAEYIIKATTEDAARGIPGVGLLLADELRTHRDYGAWGAMSKTAMAVPNALIVGISNAGDDQSIVLNDLREKAQTGADESLGLFEWSAEPGCALDDPAAWAQANPSLGHGRLTERAIKSSMLTDPPAVFRTEVLCQRVEQLRGAVDTMAWRGCADPEGNLDGLRDRLFACVELAEGGFGEHATLTVAAIDDNGRAVVEVVEAWTSYGAMEAELAGWLERVDPASRWFFPAGPAAAKASLLRELGFEEIKGVAVSEACQGLAADVRAGQVLHRDDALLTSHVAGAERLISGDGWRFTRKGAGNVDAAYAAAGAIWAARNHGDRVYDVRESLLWSEPVEE